MRTALIVEDDAAVRLTLVRVLGRHGWSADAVQGATEALELIGRSPRDVALIDWQLSERSSPSLLTMLKRHGSGRAMPVVTMHTQEELGDVGRALALGSNDFLPKPFTPEGALRKLNRWVLERAGRT